MFEAERTTGIEFCAQVRGTESLRVIRNGTLVNCSIEVENLQDHVEKRQYPVYLFRVDNETQQIYWLCLQRYALESLKDGWQTQKTVTVHVPIKNTIDAMGQFEDALRQDMQLIRELHPGSVSAAVRAEKERLKSLDPRFDCSITGTVDGTNYMFSPTVDGLAFQATFTGEEAVAKAAELVDSGGLIHFPEGTVRFSGLPQFWGEDYELAAIQIGHKSRATARFIASLDDSVPSERLDVLGQLSGGRKRGQFEFALEDGPIKPSLPVDIDQTESPVRVEFDFTNWAGRDVRVIPNLDLLVPFFEAIGDTAFDTDRATLTLEIYVQGNRVLVTACDSEFVRCLQHYSPLISTMRKAREVARQLGIEAIVPKELSWEHSLAVDVVYQLLRTGSHSVAVPVAELSIVMASSEFDSQRSQLSVKGRPISTTRLGVLPFLCGSVDLGTLRLTLTSMRLDESCTSQLDDSDVKLVFVAEPDCVQQLERIDDGQQTADERDTPVDDTKT